MNRLSAGIILSVLLVFLAFPVMAASGRDFASEVKLDMNSETVKQVVTVHTFVDGDTVHFNVPASISANGILKARFLALNTPESTGKIEEYGKKASAFTREKLSQATSIIIESDNGKWNIDSTGGRYLVWIWYRTGEDQPYRNLNIEILQNGLAIANSTAQNRYGTVASAALAYARENKLNVFSGQKDPDFYYGDAVEMTLRELRCDINKYEGIKVAFEGVITLNDGSSIYLEDYDPETGLYFGMSVYYGYGLPGKGLEILSVGNCSRIVGSVQYYEAGDSWQVSGLTYKQMKPKDPGNIQKISDGNEAAYVMIEAADLQKKVTVPGYDMEYDYGYLILNTSVEMHDLYVESIYTTDDVSSSSYGAMTLLCSQNGHQVKVRTAVLTDSSRNMITADAYEGRTIDVRGLVDCYDGSYQIRVLSARDITVKGE